MKNTDFKVIKNDTILDDLSIDQIIGRPNVEHAKRVIPYFPCHKAENERPKSLLKRLLSLNTNRI